MGRFFAKSREIRIARDRGCALKFDRGLRGWGEGSASRLFLHPCHPRSIACPSPIGGSCLRRENERAAPPAAEPFPPRLDVIRHAVIPTGISHSLHPRFSLGLSPGRFHAAAAFLRRISAYVFASHKDLCCLAWPPKSSLALRRARQGSAGNGTLLFRYPACA